MTRWTARLLGLLVFASLLVLLSSPVAAQEASAVVVDADEVVYDNVAQTIEATGNARLRYRGIRLSADRLVFDLGMERLTAIGRVVLIDARGRELRGDQLTYDIRLNMAEMRRAETIVDRVYVQSDRIRATEQRITTFGATLTTCDPARPAYRITAEEMEIIPGDRIIARRAALWLGRYQVLRLPMYVVSLREPDAASALIPRVGYNSVDGLWVDFRYPYWLGTLPGTLFAKYGARTGFLLRTEVEYPTPAYTLRFIVGRNQDTEMRPFDQGEAIVSLAGRRLGTLPVFVSAAVRYGWFHQVATGAATWRAEAGLAVRTPRIALGPSTWWETSASWRHARYGTGDRHDVLFIDSAIRHSLDAQSSLLLGYARLEQWGATPFLFDAVIPDDLRHTLVLTYTREFSSREQVAATFATGVVYDFRDRTPSVNVGYGERVRNRYHWWLRPSYNLVTQVPKLTTDVGVALGPGTYLTVQGTYNLSTRAFEDLDYIVSASLCDCIDVSLRYRQVQQEIWLMIGLTAIPQSRLQFQFPRP